MGTDDYPGTAAELAGTLLLVYWLVAPRAISHIQWEHTVAFCAELTWVVELLPQKNGGNEANQQQHDSDGENHRCISSIQIPLGSLRKASVVVESGSE